jgi:CheY-like chemotaxis protein
VRATTAALLQDSGHEIVEAADGGKALKLLAAKQTFDLLITDYAMPNVSGAEVIAGSRKMRPTLPAIMITGYADPAALPATRRVTLLTKPFTPAQMGEAIQKALTRGAAALR